MLRIRLRRGGKTHHPFYQIVVIDGRKKREGLFVDRIGTYDPYIKVSKDQYNNRKEKIKFQCKVDTEKANYWLRCGAQPSKVVSIILEH